MCASLKNLVAGIAIIAGVGSSAAWARDGIVITIPKHSELTPVQRLNREGVEAVEKHQYDKAASLFYKAYLYDPVDPFTLNNLGYISELQSDVDRAHTFYKLAAEQGSTATIDRSNAKYLQGKPMQAALTGLEDSPMRVNRMNMDAIDLLEQNRGFEAVILLKKAQAIDPANPFTTNNLGVAYESIGDYDNAMKCYEAAADTRSTEAVVVAMDRSWRGKPVSAMAAESARRLSRRMRNSPGSMQITDASFPQGSAVMYAMRGVSAVNQNDWLAARQDFIDAYTIDPTSAFSLNNRGYVAEMDGDIESAEFFYDQARRANDANARVGLATQRFAEGRSVSAVAYDSSQNVGGEIENYSQQQKLNTAPIELIPRGEAAQQPAPAQPNDTAPAATPSTAQPDGSPLVPAPQMVAPQSASPQTSEPTQGVPQ